jgi:hypothetical protein
MKTAFGPSTKFYDTRVRDSVDLVPITISSLALAISAITAYLTLFHRGP